MARHVLIIVENLTVPRDRRVWDEATTLQQAGYVVTVICPVGPGYEAAEEVLEGVRILRHPVPEDTGSRFGIIREYLHALWWERRLARQVWREHPFDAVHLCNPPELLFLVARRYQRRHGVRMVFDHHDLSPELYEAKFGRRGPFYLALRVAELLTFRSADRVLSTNETFRQVAIERGKVDPSAVTVVRNGPDPEEFAPRDPDPSVRRGRPCMAVWLGHLGHQAGVEDLVRAAAYLVHEKGRADVHFMVIGDGPGREPAERLARELGVTAFVEFTGPLWGSELVRHVGSADMGLVTMRSTGHGMMTTAVKTMEYMSLGLPVVQYDLREGRRSAGDAALYARPDDAIDLAERILWLADRPEERESMGRRGRERVLTELAWNHQAPRLLAVYRDLIGPA